MSRTAGAAFDATPVCYLEGVAKKPPKPSPSIKKVFAETVCLKRPRRGAALKEEVWQNEKGEVVKYSLAYVNPLVCRVDNGRVLGYDNRHDYHHRHFMGTVEAIEFDSYESLSARFHEEVMGLWRKEDEKEV